jgi:hypothetical protein
LKVKDKNIPKLSKTQQTDQILSGFETTESAVWISYWKYRVYKQFRHNWNNKIYNSKEQTTFDQINVIKDKFNLYSVIELLSILESEPESVSESVIQNICFISPNRIEILYQNYLARKAVFFTVYFTVWPRNYQRTAGLSTVYKKAVYKS